MKLEADINDLLDEWNGQLAQAEEYGLFFDVETVKEMLETIDIQQKEIKQLNYDRVLLKKLISADHSLTKKAPYMDLDD